MTKLKWLDLITVVSSCTGKQTTYDTTRTSLFIQKNVLFVLDRLSATGWHLNYILQLSIASR